MNAMTMPATFEQACAAAVREEYQGALGTPGPTPPADAEIRAAIRYWFGSGSRQGPPGQNLPRVRLSRMEQVCLRRAAARRNIVLPRVE